MKSIFVIERTGEVYIKQMGTSEFTNEVQKLLEF